MPSEIAGQRISAQTISTLLASRQAGPFSGFVSERGEPFNGLLRLVESDGGWQVMLEASDATGGGSGRGALPPRSENVPNAAGTSSKTRNPTGATTGGKRKGGAGS